MCDSEGWLTLDCRALHLSLPDMKGSVWNPGPWTHTAPLWANQPLSNYCEPGFPETGHELCTGQMGPAAGQPRAQAFPLTAAA